jgi:outer membrane lipoprotein SlyB
MIMKPRAYVVFVALGVGLLTGCAPTLSPDVYGLQNAGQVNRVEQGVIVSTRVVKVTGNSDDLGGGTIAGGALGALAGSQIGGGTGSVVAGIGGAILGGMAGNQAQAKLSSQAGVEYVVRLRNRKLISVVQGPQPTFMRGQHVLVQYSRNGRSRITADPNYFG